MYSQRDFFHTVLSSEGKPCIAKLVVGSNKPYFAHDVFDSIDDLCDALDTIDFSEHNYYFCISTLKERSVLASKGDKQVKRVRVQTNALKTRCFVLDVDIRPDKQGYYKTIEEGIAGVQAVVDAFSIPKPIIVNSGFGLHVYWPMAEGVDSADWRKTAHRFKQAVGVIAPELVADSSRVADSAGVLRIPNSYNLKSNPPTPVQIIQWSDNLLDYGEFKTLLERITGGPSEAVKQVKTGIKSTSIDSKPGDFNKVARNCNWLGEYLKNRKDASEPEWYAVLGLVPYLILEKNGKEHSGPTLAHAISKGHEGYDPQATYDKYMQAKNGQTGPTTCARFQGINSERCKGCPFAATVKTPIGTSDLDRAATKEEIVTTTTVGNKGDKQEETVTIPLPPKPYFRGENGGVFVRVKKQLEDGSWDEVIIKVYDYDIYPVRRFRTETLENEFMEIHVWLPKDGLRKFKLPSALLADGKALAKFLSEKGVVAEFGKGAPLVKYLIDYVRYMQMAKAAEVEFSRLGWRELYTPEPKFVLGDGYMTKDGVVHPSTHADFLRKAAESATTRGTIEDWKQGFMVYQSIPNSEAFIIASLLGFAAPLMALTEYSGVLYNMAGHSAAGKSTAMRVMTSTWGKPTATHILKNDTEISAFNFIGYLNNIPVAYDELTNLDPDKLSDFCLNFTTGRGKMRATRDGQNRHNEVQWETIVCATSNTSLYDKLAANRKGYNAEAMRIFELPVGVSNPQYKTHVDERLRLLSDNYGHAGRQYLLYIMPRLENIKQVLHKATDIITARGKLRNEERFWGALLACILVGGKIAKDRLQLHNYDVDALVDWTLGLSSDVRANVINTASDPVSLLAQFFNNNLNSVLRIEEGKPQLSGMQGNMNSIKARIEYENAAPRWAYISVPAIKEYCAYHKIDPSWFRRELSDVGIIVQENLQRRLTSGTTLPSVNVKTWKVDMMHQRLIGIEIPVADATGTE